MLRTLLFSLPSVSLYYQFINTRLDASLRLTADCTSLDRIRVYHIRSIHVEIWAQLDELVVDGHVPINWVWIAICPFDIVFEATAAVCHVLSGLVNA